MAQRSMTFRMAGGLVLLFALAVSVGCAAPAAGRGSGPESQVVSLRVLTSPAPVVIGEGTRPNGIWAQVYAFTQGQSRAVTLPPGTLELLLFDGSVRGREVSEEAPHLRVAHRDDHIARAAATTVAGVRYALPVRWNDDPPESGIATLVVRFVPDDGPTVYSSAVSVRLGPT